MNGYICMASKKRLEPGVGEPLAYGTGKDPYQRLLLKGRGATIFPTKKEAMGALKATLTTCDKEGYEWQSAHRFWFVEVREP